MFIGKKLLWLSMLAILSVNAADIRLKDFNFRKSPGSIVQWDSISNKILRMKFVPGNPFSASAWFSKITPHPKAGVQYRIAVTIKQTGLTDPQAKINISVVGGNRKAESLGTKRFQKVALAMDFSEWKTLELLFTLPEKGKDKKWNDAKTFLSSIGVNSANGTFLFKDYIFEELSTKVNISN